MSCNIHSTCFSLCAGVTVTFKVPLCFFLLLISLHLTRQSSSREVFSIPLTLLITLISEWELLQSIQLFQMPHFAIWVFLFYKRTCHQQDNWKDPSFFVLRQRKPYICPCWYVGGSATTSLRGTPLSRIKSLFLGLLLVLCSLRSWTMASLWLVVKFLLSFLVREVSLLENSE